MNAKHTPGPWKATMKPVNTLADAVREQIWYEGPDDATEDYIDEQLRTLNSLELLNYISDALQKLTLRPT